MITGLCLKGTKDIEIHLQDGFNIKDSCSLSINECRIFNNKTFSEFEGLDFTGCMINSHFDSGYYIIVDTQRIDTIQCSQSDSLVIKFTINRIKSELKIDRSKGAYIGISKNEDGTVDFRQINYPFTYE